MWDALREILWSAMACVLMAVGGIVLAEAIFGWVLFVTRIFRWLNG